ncbi:MAG: hypothetical protein WBM50_28160, partial [Acidimicrobiales bacterium]
INKYHDDYNNTTEHIVSDVYIVDLDDVHACDDDVCPREHVYVFTADELHDLIRTALNFYTAGDFNHVDVRAAVDFLADYNAGNLNHLAAG